MVYVCIYVTYVIYVNSLLHASQCQFQFMYEIMAPIQIQGFERIIRIQVESGILGNNVISDILGHLTQIGEMLKVLGYIGFNSNGSFLIRLFTF